jgi:LemA protein
MAVTALLALLGGWLAAYVIFIRSGRPDERPGMRVLLSFAAGAATAFLAMAVWMLCAGAVPSGMDFIPAGMLLLGLGIGWIGQSMWLSGQLIANTPVSRIRSAPQGWVKLRGQAIVEEPVYSRTGNIPCLYYSERTERYTRHTRRVQDPQTKEWRSETYYSWDHYSSASGAAPFRLTDGTGEVTVDVRATAFSPAHSAQFYNGRPGSGGIFAREGDLRTTVNYIALDSQLEAAGRLHRGVLTRHPTHGAALVGEGSLGGVATVRKLGGCFGIMVGGVLAAGAPLSPSVLAGMAGENNMDFNSALALVFAGAALGLVLLGWMVSLYNAIITLKRQAERAWSDIDVQLQMRWDLVPNLVETVKAYAQHERQIFEATLAARERALGARDRRTRISAEDRLEQTLPSLLAIAEDYPQLKASENFLKLQQQLQEMEDVIADRRETYNDSATNFNTFIQSFPGLLMAGALSEKPLPLFQAEPAARQHPLSGASAAGSGQNQGG